MSDGHLVITRHRLLHLPQYTHAADQEPKPFVPIGVNLTRPFPGARVYDIDHRDGWIYVYWVPNDLTVASNEEMRP